MRKAPRRRRRSAVWVVVLVGAGVFCFYVLPIVFVVVLAIRNQPPPSAGSPEMLARDRADQAEVAADLHDPDPPTAADVATFAPVLKRLGAAVHEKDRAAVAACWDYDRLCDECAALGAFHGGLSRNGTATERKEYITELRKLVPDNMLGFNPPRSWDETTILRVKRTAGGDEALVYAIHDRDAGRGPWLMTYRWWLVRRPGGWRVFDYENLISRDRYSVSLLPEDEPGLPPEATWRAAQTAIAAANEAIVRRDADAAEKHLRRARGVRMPYRGSNDLALAEADLALLNGDFSKAADHLEAAKMARPDVPLVYRRQLHVYYHLRQYEAAIAAGEQYYRMLGPDRTVLGDTALALEAVGRREEAAAYHRRALDRWPDDVEAFAGLARVLPKGGRGELGDRLARAPDPQQAFDRAVMSVLIDGELGAAADLAEVFRRLRPDAPGGWAKGANVAIRQGDPEAAGRFLADAVRRAGDRPARDEILSGFLHAAVAADQAAAGYATAAAIDRRFAFRALADRLTGDIEDDDGDVDELAAALDAVVAEHRKADPGDPWLDYVSGRLHERGKRFEEADRKFAAVAARLPAPAVGPPLPDTFPRDDHSTLRFARTYCWFRLGKGLAAYHEFGGDRERFNQLAHLYEGESDAEGLEQLVAAHAKRDPADPEVMYFRAGAHWLAKRYEDAVALYRTYWEKVIKKTDRDNDFVPFEWSVRDRIVRSLVRLGKFDEAKTALETMPVKWPGILPVLVAAAAGDVVATEAAMKDVVGDHGRPDWLYADPDLGPLLKGERFKSVRDAFPPTEEKPAEVKK